MNKKYAGIFPAFYACYDKNGEINAQAVQDLTEYLIGKSVYIQMENFQMEVIFHR